MNASQQQLHTCESHNISSKFETQKLHIIISQLHFGTTTKQFAAAF